MSNCMRCQGAGIRNGRTICYACVAQAADALTILFRHRVRPGDAPSPTLLDELRITVTRQSRLSVSFGSRSADVPLVFHVAAAAIYREISAFLITQALHYRIVSLKDARPEFYAAYLHSRIDQIAKSEGAADFVNELIRLQVAIIEVIDRPADLWFAGPCHVCEADLYVTEGSPVATCQTCNATIDVAAQRERLLAAVDDVLATAAEISRAAHITGQVVTPSKITNLYHRGKLIRHGRNRTGDHLYRVGDVLAVLHAQRMRSAG